MKTMIEQLYDNDWRDSSLRPPPIEGHNEARQEALAAYEKLGARMCGELNELFEDFVNKDISASAFSKTQAFMQGFKLAGRLFSEVYLE